MLVACTRSNATGLCRKCLHNGPHEEVFYPGVSIDHRKPGFCSEGGAVRCVPVQLQPDLFGKKEKEKVMQTEDQAAQAGKEATETTGTPYTPPEIEMIPVESSNIESVGHDGAETLRMKFKSGAALYDYVGVPEEKFIDLINSPSVGKAWRGVVGEIKGIKLAAQQ